MPQKTQDKRPTSKPRKPVKGRDARHQVVRIDEVRVHEGTPIAGSIYALRLPKRYYTEIYALHHPEKPQANPNYILADLRECYLNYWKLVREKKKPAPKLSGANVYEQLADLCGKMKGILPADHLSYASDDEGKFYLKASCDFSKEYGWSAFEIERVFKKLRRNDDMLNLTLTFIVSICKHAGIQFWWQSPFYDYALHAQPEIWAEEYSMDEMGAKDFYKFNKQLESYLHGAIYAIQKKLDSIVPLDKNELVRWISTHRKTKLTKCLLEYADIFDFPYTLSQLDSTSDEDNLFTLENQYTLIWNIDDSITTSATEYMDALAMEYIAEPPYYAFDITPISTAYYNDSEMSARQRFISMIDNFFFDMYNLFSCKKPQKP